MKAILNNVFTVCIAAVVLMSSVGIYVNQVFCSDRGEFHYSFSLSSLKKVCTCSAVNDVKEKSSCCSKKKDKKKKNCCSNNSLRVELDDDYNIKSNNVDFKPIKKNILQPVYSYIIPVYDFSVYVDKEIYPPPNIHRDIIVSIQSFLI